MSRVGKLPVNIPANVNVKIEKDSITISQGQKKLTSMITNDVTITQDGSQIKVLPVDDSKQSRSRWGLYRSLINNMVEGVSKGFEKILEIKGTGYRASVNGKHLFIYLGHSHSIAYSIPSEIEVVCDKSVITIKGICKQKVGQVAATIRSFRPLEPYKLKGVKYRGEFINQKAGKKK